MGRSRNVSLTVSPIRNESGRIIGASKIARDITDRVRNRGAFAADDGRGQRRAATAPTVFRFPSAGEENVPRARRESYPPVIRLR